MGDREIPAPFPARSGDAAAARTGWTEKAVTVRLTRLRRRLREHRKEWEVLI